MTMTSCHKNSISLQDSGFSISQISDEQQILQATETVETVLDLEPILACPTAWCLKYERIPFNVLARTSTRSLPQA